jgi:hypothetical protein
MIPRAELVVRAPAGMVVQHLVHVVFPLIDGTVAIEQDVPRNDVNSQGAQLEEVGE